MRLEEWQKYIETQFLDDEPPPKPAASSPPPKQAEPAASIPAEPDPQKTLPLEEAVTPPELLSEVRTDAASVAEAAIPVVMTSQVSVPADLATLSQPPVVKVKPAEPIVTDKEERRKSTRQQTLSIYPVFTPPTNKKPGDESADTPGSATTSPPDTAFDVAVAPARDAPTRPPSVEAAPHTATAKFGPLPDLDADIPSFEGYLRSRQSTLQVESETGKQAVSSGPQENTSPSNSTPSVQEAQPARSADAATVEASTDHCNATAPQGRRVPRSRARHARNIRPENVHTGLSAGDLWATVPKHVKTLLALERLEEEQEVAQYSYKRPFQEKRQELIERLLDPILSLEDTARLLNVCPTTVRRYTNKGILTYYRKEPERSKKSASGDLEKETRQRRFRLSDILTFLETQQAAIEADRQAERKAASTQQAETATAETAPYATPTDERA